MTPRHRSHQHHYAEEPILPPIHREARRGIRFESRQPRVIEWEDTEGNAHHLEGSTRIVGAYGCKLQMPHALPLGQRITVIDTTRSTSVIGTVVSRGKERPEGCEMGVELLQPNMDIWVRDPQLPPSEERRRGQRAILSLPVVLHFKPHNLSPLAFPAHTLSVNDHGATVLCNRSFPPGTQIELENRRTWKKIICVVKRQPKETPDGFQLPLAFAAPVLGFWPVSFPPPQ